MSKNFTRRQFLRTTIVTSATIGAIPSLLRAAKPPALHSSGSANADIRVAVVGFNQRGTSHIQGFKDSPGVRLVALCDVDSAVLAREAGKLSGIQTYTDIRKLLENKDVDVVTFATPNHWHALGAIWAVQAGKDVYLEKPVSHNVWEGQQIVSAARKYNKMVQTGTQCRSSEGLREAQAWFAEGHLGKIKVSRGLCYKRRPSIGKTDGAQPVPSTVDYDLWCGPAPKEPLTRKKLHYDWHWVWPTGNGDLGNQGIHQMDIARWFLGENTLSPRVFAVGGRLGYVDDATTPNTLTVIHDYAKAPLIFEVRGLPTKTGTEEMDNYRGAKVGVVIDCEGGSLLIPSYSEAIAYDKQNKEIKRFKASGDHFANFIKAVRSRKSSDLHADITEGHLSSALCHTGNISYKLGKQRSPDKIKDALKKNDIMSECWERMREHLSANGVDLKKTPVRLGAFLKMDTKTQKFVGNTKANRLLTREYRKPFVVPAKV
jgi:predicted dehydrogenase